MSFTRFFNFFDLPTYVKKNNLIYYEFFDMANTRRKFTPCLKSISYFAICSNCLNPPNEESFANHKSLTVAFHHDKIKILKRPNACPRPSVSLFLLLTQS